MDRSSRMGYWECSRGNKSEATMNEKGQEKGITLRLRLYKRYCNWFRDFLSRPEEAYRSRSSKVFSPKRKFCFPFSRTFSCHSSRCLSTSRKSNIFLLVHGFKRKENKTSPHPKCLYGRGNVHQFIFLPVIKKRPSDSKGDQAIFLAFTPSGQHFSGCWNHHWYLCGWIELGKTESHWGKQF